MPHNLKLQNYHSKHFCHSPVGDNKICIPLPNTIYKGENRTGPGFTYCKYPLPRDQGKMSRQNENGKDFD